MVKCKKDTFLVLKQFYNHDNTQTERNLRYDLDMAIVFYNAF